jgi:mono/diheme cytochrome c family protein
MESDMKGRWIFAVLSVWLASHSIASAQPNSAVSRGELLYSTHCIACHTAKVHWRDKKLARDWISLKTQVRRWQGIEGLKWSDDDIAEVARHLNALHYRYPELVK